MSVAEDVVYRYIDAHFRFATPRNAATVDDTRHAHHRTRGRCRARDAIAQAHCHSHAAVGL